jgi:Fur family ferric uptake transcriptional regulator
MTKSNLMREIEERLAERQVRFTRGRRTVVSTLSLTEGPLSAAELHRLIGTAIPLSSLYRSLAVLEQAGVLEPHLGKKGVARYELAEWLGGHHHHLVCIECGAVDDVELPESYEIRVAELVRGIGDIARFTPVNHALEIEGRCTRCA